MVDKALIVRLPDETRDKLRAIAKQEGKTVSNLLREIIESRVDKGVIDLADLVNRVEALERAVFKR